MKRKQRLKSIPVMLILLDAIAAIVGWEISFFIRFTIFPDILVGQFAQFFYYSLLITGLVLIFNTANHLYQSNRYLSWYKEFVLVIKSQIYAIASFIILIYFSTPAPYRISRFTIALYAIWGLIISLSMRAFVRSCLNKSAQKGKTRHHIILAGKGKVLENYIALLNKASDNGIHFVGWVGNDSIPEGIDIPKIAIKDIELDGPNAPDSVIIGYNHSNHHELEENLAFFNKTPINILILPDIENAFIGYTIENFHGVPLISVNAARINAWQALVKRCMDIGGSLVGLILLSPLFFVLGFWVKLTSKGPIFYSQERMTKDGTLFNMWKFRSMMIDAEQHGAKWASKDDDRCTRIGRFMRRTSLDELPQLWNVLKGDMSLVGPRPERPVFIENFKHSIPSYMLRHKMKSGITGWAQVNGWRGNTSLERRIECDLYYIRNWTLLLDLKILIFTFIKGFVHENAY